MIKTCYIQKTTIAYFFIFLGDWPFDYSIQLIASVWENNSAVATTLDQKFSSDRQTNEIMNQKNFKSFNLVTS